MDSHKPLTAAEIEELKQLCANYANPCCGVVEADVWKAFNALPRLLSLLTPPADAAVHEARNIIAAIECDIHGKRNGEICKVSVESLRTLLRAVQAPLLGLSALLPDDFSDSKDWRDGDPAERIEWLKSMLTAMREREAEAWKQGELSPRLTGEQREMLREMDAYFERMDTNGFRNGLRLYWPEAFSAGEM